MQVLESQGASPTISPTKSATSSPTKSDAPLLKSEAGTTLPIQVVKAAPVQASLKSSSPALMKSGYVSFSGLCNVDMLKYLVAGITMFASVLAFFSDSISSEVFLGLYFSALLLAIRKPSSDAGTPAEASTTQPIQVVKPTPLKASVKSSAAAKQSWSWKSIAAVSMISVCVCVGVMEVRSGSLTVLISEMGLSYAPVAPPASSRFRWFGKGGPRCVGPACGTQKK